MIRSIGLFWEREHVFWGAGIQAGKLLGVPERNVRRNPIDFREQIGLYALYSEFDLLYIGQAGSGVQTLFKRLKKHQRGYFAGRWNRFSWYGMLWVRTNDKLSSPTDKFHPTRKQALDFLEAVVIETAGPFLNNQSGRFGKDTIFFRQVRDPRLGPTRDELLKQVHSVVVPKKK